MRSFAKRLLRRLRDGYRKRKARARGRWYPDQIVAGDFGGSFDKTTIGFLGSPECALSGADKSTLQIAEFGIWRGATSLKFAEFLDQRGTLHLFDYQDNVTSVAEALAGKGYRNVRRWGSSYKYLDSYNWSLMKLLKETEAPILDYAYLDGAHTWAIDALNFLLCDLLLKPGGYVDFDDYHWRLKGSSLDPEKVPETGRLYTGEQIEAPQVKLIVDLLVRRNPAYREVIENKIFQKIA